MERIWKGRWKTKIEPHISLKQSKALKKKRALRAACPQSKQVFVLLSGWSRAISTAAFEIWDNIAR